MNKKIEMKEVFGSQEIQALVGCVITSVKDDDAVNGEGIFLDAKDEKGNRLCLTISDDGSWQFYDSKVERVAEAIGEIAMLVGCSDIDSVHFNKADPLTEIVIRPIGPNAADRVITMLRGMFPMLEVSEDKWNFEGECHSMYQCCDPDYNFTITVAVMPGGVFNDIGRD